MKEKGTPIEVHDPKPDVRKGEETAPDWPYREEAKYLYGMASLFKDRFLDPIARTDRDRLTDPVISFKDMRNWNTLAAYSLVRNELGLLDEIMMNTQHYKEQDGKMEWEFGRWAQLETLLHEQVHLWQQNSGKDPIKLGNVYHNKEFVAKCESLGLHPKIGEGYHIKLADGLFEVLMNELGIDKPKGLEKAPTEFDIDWFKWLLDFKGKKRKGRSSLAKWSCGCQNARIGIKDFRAKCTREDCGNVFVRVDIPHQIIYEREQNSIPETN